MLYRDGAWRCENPACGKPLHVDHVLLITTAHVRRFCDVECVARGWLESMDRIMLAAGLEVEREKEF